MLSKYVWFSFPYSKKLFSNNKNAFKKMFLPHWEKKFQWKKKSFEQVKSFETRLCIKIMGFFLEPQNFFPFKNKNPWIFLEIFFSKSRYFSKTIFLLKKKKEKKEKLVLPLQPCLFKRVFSKKMLKISFLKLLKKTLKKSFQILHAKIKIKLIL